jgi:hypothetical protein
LPYILDTASTSVAAEATSVSSISDRDISLQFNSFDTSALSSVPAGVDASAEANIPTIASLALSPRTPDSASDALIQKLESEMGDLDSVIDALSIDGDTNTDTTTPIPVTSATTAETPQHPAPSTSPSAGSMQNLASFETTSVNSAVAAVPSSSPIIACAAATLANSTTIAQPAAAFSNATAIHKDDENSTTAAQQLADAVVEAVVVEAVIDDVIDEAIKSAMPADGFASGPASTAAVAPAAPTATSDTALVTAATPTEITAILLGGGRRNMLDDLVGDVLGVFGTHSSASASASTVVSRSPKVQLIGDDALDLDIVDIVA